MEDWPHAASCMHFGRFELYFWCVERSDIFGFWKQEFCHSQLWHRRRVKSWIADWSFPINRSSQVVRYARTCTLMQAIFLSRSRLCNSSLHTAWRDLNTCEGNQDMRSRPQMRLYFFGNPVGPRFRAESQVCTSDLLLECFIWSETYLTTLPDNTDAKRKCEWE